MFLETASTMVYEQDTNLQVFLRSAGTRFQPLPNCHSEREHDDWTEGAPLAVVSSHYGIQSFPGDEDFGSVVDLLVR